MSLKKWFNEKWVDIGSPKKGGGYKECGRKSASGSKRKYPKCVPAAKAARMTAQKSVLLLQEREQPVTLEANQITSAPLPRSITVV
jgi:hypothetical protein